MKKMRKMVSLALTAAMTAGLMTGMGALTASADSERTKITALLKGTESTEQFQTFDYLLKNFCDEKGLDYEIELVNDMQDYFTKLQMYINSDTLPDIFGCPNGTLSAACKDIDALVDVGAELERNGYADKLNGAIRDFLTDADDGNLYLFPQGLYCEYFMYRKDIFEDAGITDAPTTWEEFEEDCQKIADLGEIPVIVGGSDAWQLMRYLSFSPWRVTGPEFIQGYQAGTDSFSENESAKYAVNLLSDLGTKGYFEPGFASVDFTSACNLFQTFDYLLKNFCDEKGLDYEIELVNDMQDYFTKLQMYINSDTLPDIFGCPNGTLSAACKDIDALVDVGAELERNGYADKLNGAIRDFLTDADDGNLYLFPQGLYCEYFMYRKDIFEDAGITDAPTTWEEFEEDCQKIADLGEIPVIVGGSDAWQLMRYLSFSPWRVTGPEFIQGYQAGTDSFSENESAKYAVNLLSDLGTKGYFEPGFASVDFTSACNLFFGGTGAIFYTGSGQISLAEEMYDNGELGFFPVPDTEGMDNMATNVPIHAGFAEGFNKATYDDTMQEFFDYMCENFSDACYNQAHVFSPFNEDSLPEGLPQLYYDTQPMFEDAETAWTSWDDKLDSDVMTKIVDEQQKLAQGITTPDEFIETCDSFIK